MSTPSQLQQARATDHQLNPSTSRPLTSRDFVDASSMETFLRECKVATLLKPTLAKDLFTLLQEDGRASLHLDDTGLLVKGISDVAFGTKFAVNTFDNDSELSTYLQKHNILVENWGKGRNKTVQNLLQELLGSESALIFSDDGSLMRLTKVARLMVCRELARPRSKGKFLIESKQTLKDGRERVRNQFPSEKMLPTEFTEPLLGAKRCISEELSFYKGAKEYHDSGIHTEEVVSGSYPGLKTRYELFTFEVVMPELPADDFESSEEDGKEVTCRHFWKWCSWEEVQERFSVAFPENLQKKDNDGLDKRHDDILNYIKQTKQVDGPQNDEVNAPKSSGTDSGAGTVQVSALKKQRME